MIGLRLMGGIGNLMFQIATGETWRSMGYDVVYTGMDENLSYIHKNYSFQRHSGTYKRMFDGFVWDDHRASKNTSLKPNYAPFVYTEITPVNSFEYIGYFQSELNFPNKALIRELFQPSEWIREQLTFPCPKEITCSIHVRRQDYLKLSEYHKVLEMDYYETAIKALEDHNIDKFLVFSDDISWCKENFIGDKFVFMDSLEYIAIYQMGMCNHNIIANSSMSWWGAWLRDNEDRVVIAPDKWFGIKGQDPKDICPLNWIKI